MEDVPVAAAAYYFISAYNHNLTYLILIHYSIPTL
jgi:hypothetical protein